MSRFFGILVAVSVIVGTCYALYDATVRITNRTRALNRSEERIAVQWVRVHPGVIEYKSVSGTRATIKFVGDPKDFTVTRYESRLGETMYIRSSFAPDFSDPEATVFFYRIYVPRDYPLTDKDPE